jgi:hypothetical protein
MKSELDFDDSSYFEKLPYDVFRRLILSNNIQGEELINLCKSSPKVTAMCEYKDNQIYKDYASKFNVIEMYKPFEKSYKFFATSYWDSGIHKPHIQTVPTSNKARVIDLIIPDVVFENFAQQLNITVAALISYLLTNPRDGKSGAFYHHYHVTIFHDENGQYAGHPEFPFDFDNKTVDVLSILCKVKSLNPNVERYIVNGILFKEGELQSLVEMVNLIKRYPQIAGRSFR